tara:strand:+ start:218 stop:517 length:300 start_codon:yes stop_codon:yes gene_type:complete
MNANNSNHNNNHNSSSKDKRAPEAAASLDSTASLDRNSSDASVVGSVERGSGSLMDHNESEMVEQRRREERQRRIETQQATEWVRRIEVRMESLVEAPM